MEDEEGNQYSICRLADGTEVEEWEYYRADHPEETVAEEVAEEITEEAPAEEVAE
ncbi:DUF333 domain-containing protein [bacterium]|nr:DUF333 domain-containing protein [bacterium]